LRATVSSFYTYPWHTVAAVPLSPVLIHLSKRCWRTGRVIWALFTVIGLYTPTAYRSRRVGSLFHAAASIIHLSKALGKALLAGKLYYLVFSLCFHFIVSSMEKAQ